MSRKYVEGFLNVTDPQGGRPDNDLPGGGYVGRPDNDLPGGGGRPDNDLPGSGAGLWGWRLRLIRWAMGPHVSGGPIKPPGFPVVPVDPDWDKPTLPPHPWLPFLWVPVDPGFGKPPRWGRLPVDPGYGMPEGGGPTGPNQDLPGGEYVPVDPDYDLPVHERRCGGGADHIWGKRPLWIWLDAEPKPEPK